MKNFTIVLCTIALLLTGKNIVNAQRIEVTITGTGTMSHSGDGGSGRTAAVYQPNDVCRDAAQNLYFADKGNSRIRMQSAKTGVITTIAGGDTSIADGIAATSAYLIPNYMCISPAGNLYVTAGDQIRMINLASGIIVTVAGSWAAPGFSGDGGPASAATLNSPEGICLDATGNLYFVDRGNSRIRKINATTGIITTIAGTRTTGYTGDGGLATAATLDSPAAICVNAAGDVFFSDQEPGYPLGLNASYLRKITAATGIISTIAGVPGAGSSGPIPTSGVLAVNAYLGTVTGLCTDVVGDIFINEMSCSTRELDVTSDSLNLVAGNFGIEGFLDDISCTASNMNTPMGICMDNATNFYVADNGNNRIRKLIQLTHTPAFAFGHGQYFVPAVGSATTIDSLLWITDLDSAQTETWTVIIPPVNGALSGFPATALSNGTHTTVKPSGTSYTPLSTYTDEDIFSVRVSDGLLADTIIIYVGDSSLNKTPIPSSVTNTLAVTPEINIYPNPASSALHIQWSNLQAGNDNVTITDITGRAVYNTSLTSNTAGTMLVNISAIPAGLYIVKVSGSVVRKFVKE